MARRRARVSASLLQKSVAQSRLREARSRPTPRVMSHFAWARAQLDVANLGRRRKTSAERVERQGD